MVVDYVNHRQPAKRDGRSYQNENQRSSIPTLEESAPALFGLHRLIPRRRLVRLMRGVQPMGGMMPKTQSMQNVTEYRPGMRSKT